jgi:hypothetical protein
MSKMAPFFEQRWLVEPFAGVKSLIPCFIESGVRCSERLLKGDQEALAELDALNLPPEIRQQPLILVLQKEVISTQAKLARMEKPKFDRYNTPGGQNAREIYLTLPLKKSTEAEARSVVGNETWSRMTPEQRQEFMSYPTEAAKQNQFTAPSAHSVSPEADANRLAHIFLDERKDAKGNNVCLCKSYSPTGRRQAGIKGLPKRSPSI